MGNNAEYRIRGITDFPDTIILAQPTTRDTAREDLENVLTLIHTSIYSCSRNAGESDVSTKGLLRTENLAVNAADARSFARKGMRMIDAEVKQYALRRKSQSLADMLWSYRPRELLDILEVWNGFLAVFCIDND